MERALHIIVEKKSLALPQEVQGKGKTQHLPLGPSVEQWHSPSLPAPVTLVGDTGSVLDDAWALVAQDALPVWGSVLAQSQSAGRGQTRRQWHSPRGNIYAALRLPTTDAFAHMGAAPALSTLLLLAMQQLGYHLRLKWPNDLVLASGKHKVGGILLEERQGVLLAGIGINTLHAPEESILRKNHAFPAGILPPLEQLKDSITFVNNCEFSADAAAAQCLWLHLVSQVYFCYKKKLLEDAAWKDIAETFLLWKGHYVELDDGQEIIQGVLHGLGSLGEIILDVHGQKQQCTSGSLRLK